MRIESAVVLFTLIIGLVLYFGSGYSGWFSGGPWLLGVAAGTGLLVYLLILTGQNTMNVKEFVKQIAVWLSITVLLPLTVWFGTSVFHPPPESKHYYRSTSRLGEKIRESKDEAQKEKLYQEQYRLEDEMEAAWRDYYRTMFWVAYPIGLVTLIIGVFFPVHAVGAGLMFGGLSSLSAGCYSYWDSVAKR